MRSKQRSLGLICALGLGAAGTAYAAQIDAATLGGWTPVVTLWGGDVDGAIRTLDQLTHALSASIHHYEIDEPTQEFINGLLDELEDFDLDGAYDLLPDARNGGRELNVKGKLVGNRYLVQRAQPGSPYGVTMNGPRSAMADMSLYVRAQQREGKEHDTLLLSGSAGLGTGPLTFRAVAEAQRELLRMVTVGHPAADGQPLPKSGLAREAVREMNPGLGEEDLDALALLFDSYPLLGRALVNLGRVQDLRTGDQGDYYHITTKLIAEPSRMKQRYPALAKHAKKLRDIVHATIRLVDEQERDLLRLKVDSGKLTAHVELYVKDGLVLPFVGSKVFKDEPVDPLSGALKNASVLVEGRFEMLGIVAKLNDLRIDGSFEAHDSYAVLDARLTKMPRLEIQGRALGLFAPGVLDLFIPGNIEGITAEFLRVITRGNGGKGLRMRGELGAKTMGAPGAVSGSGSFEIMDTFLVKMGGGMVADRLLITPEEKDEAFKLAGDLHSAFSKDLASFKRRVGR